MAKWKGGASASLAAVMTVGLWSGTAIVNSALAQPSAPATPTTTSEDIVITGSYIRGTPEDAALPVDVISQKDLERQGSPTVLQ
ncbi:MAG TPA: hypothetical protein VG983_07935, partial [Caulobacterales bacterium]|nr:hypothetical protein [Caulobacterales bacterium]